MNRFVGLSNELIDELTPTTVGIFCPSREIISLRTAVALLISKVGAESRTFASALRDAERLKRKCFLTNAVNLLITDCPRVSNRTWRSVAEHATTWARARKRERAAYPRFPWRHLFSRESRAHSFNIASSAAGREREREVASSDALAYSSALLIFVHIARNPWRSPGYSANEFFEECL